MDSRIAALVAEQGGVFSAAEAGARGVDPLRLRAAVRERQVIAVRRGAYVSRPLLAASDADARFRLTAMAVARTRPGDALSHHAALALHGLPLWRVDTTRIDLLGDVRQVVRRSGVTVRPRGEPDAVEVLGLPVVPVADAVVGAALTMGSECAVVAGDRALHTGRVELWQLLEAAARVTPHQGRQRVVDAVLRMDPKSESVGESRTRMILQDVGLEHESQHVIRDADGFVARVDFLVEGVVLEFDGRVKYERTRDPGDEAATDPGQVVWLEKRREDRVRRLGYPFERVVWDELARPAVLTARIRAARALSRSA